MATIRQRGNRWQCIIKRKGHPLLSNTFDLKKDAEKWARQQERAIDAGQWIDRTEAEQTTLEELLKRYAKEVSASKRGKDAEEVRIEQFKKTNLAKYSVASITGQMVAEWRDSRLKEVSGSTVCRDLTLLSHVFSVAIREWGIALHSNPVSLIRKPPAGKPRDRILTNDQRAALTAACGQCQSPWIKSVVIFALETATRRGEILSLTWNNVSLEGRTALVSGKTGSRKVPLSPACTGAWMKHDHQPGQSRSIQCGHRTRPATGPRVGEPQHRGNP